MAYLEALTVRGKSRARAKNGDCHQFAPCHGPRNKSLSLKRIGWLYPIFRNLHFYHGLLREAKAAFSDEPGRVLDTDEKLDREGHRPNKPRGWSEG